MRLKLACSAAAALLTADVLPAAEVDGIAEYRAQYEVRYNGRRVAAATFSVAQIADGLVFESSTRARGLLRLARPRPAIERSEFRVVDDTIRPSRFVYEDGSRGGDDNYALDFDRASSEITISTDNGSRSLPLEAGLLDRGSLQVALMRDLARCTEPGPYRLVDEEGVKVYTYERLDDLPAETGVGDLGTVRYLQQRQGSSRSTIVWAAPGLGYLPVRIEQIRNGEVETVFTLDEVDGIAASADSCSGLR